MHSAEPFYLYTLRESLSRRQKANHAYSLRSFARDLGIDSSNLSAILQGKRALPASRAEAIVRRLALPAKEAGLFVFSTQKKKNGLNAIQVKEAAKQYLLDDRYFRVIAEWTMTMAIDPSKLPAARAIIREFQDKLSTLLSEDSKTEVYQFNCQLFPLTQKES